MLRLLDTHLKKNDGLAVAQRRKWLAFIGCAADAATASCLFLQDSTVNILNGEHNRTSHLAYKNCFPFCMQREGNAIHIIIMFFFVLSTAWLFYRLPCVCDAFCDSKACPELVFHARTHWSSTHLSSLFMIIVQKSSCLIFSTTFLQTRLIFRRRSKGIDADDDGEKKEEEKWTRNCVQFLSQGRREKNITFLS